MLRHFGYSDNWMPVTDMPSNQNVAIGNRVMLRHFGYSDLLLPVTDMPSNQTNMPVMNGMSLWPSCRPRSRYNILVIIRFPITDTPCNQNVAISLGHATTSLL